MSFHLQLVHKNIHEGSSFSSSPHQVLYNQVTESGRRMDPRPSVQSWFYVIVVHIKIITSYMTAVLR